MMSRVSEIIRDLDREAEHQRRLDRVKRSEEVYNAACDEAIQHDITLTKDRTTYTIADARHTLVFYAFTNSAFVQRVGKSRGEAVKDLPETDVYDMVLLFCEGAFLK